MAKKKSTRKRSTRRRSSSTSMGEGTRLLIVIGSIVGLAFAIIFIIHGLVRSYFGINLPYFFDVGVGHWVIGWWTGSWWIVLDIIVVIICIATLMSVGFMIGSLKFKVSWVSVLIVSLLVMLLGSSFNWGGAILLLAAIIMIIKKM